MYLLCWEDAGQMYSIWPRYVSGAVGARGGKDASHPISDLASPLEGGEATLWFGVFSKFNFNNGIININLNHLTVHFWSGLAPCG